MRRRVDDPDAAVARLERHETRQEAKRVRILERAPPGLVEALAADYAARGLRPVVDAELEMVCVDCPFCRAHECDPLGIYRPMRIVPRARMTGDGKPLPPLLTIICESCHFHDERSP